MTLPATNQSNGSDGSRSDEEPIEPPAGMVEAAETVVASGGHVADLEAKLRAMEKLSPIMAALQEEADILASTQRRTEVRVTRAADDAERIQTEMERLKDTVGVAGSLKKDLTQLAQLVTDAGDFEALATRVSTQVEALEEQRDAIGRALDTVRDLDRLAQQLDSVTARQQEHARELGEFGAHARELKGLQAEVMDRSSQIRTHQVQIDAQDQATLEELAAIRAAVRRSHEQVEFATREFDSVQERLAGLRTGLADLETQFAPLRDADRKVGEVESRADHLSARLDTIAEDCRGLDALEARVGAVKAVHAEVMDRAERVTTLQHEIDHKAETAREGLAEISRGVLENIERTDAAHREFDSLATRTSELGETVADVEERIRGLEESRQTIADVQEAAERLSARLSTLTADRERLDQESERILAMRGDVYRLDESVQDMEQRVGRMEELRADLDTVSRELADLHRTRETITEAMEQTRLAQGEVAQLREEQAENQKWLIDGKKSVQALHGSVESLEALKPTVESVREEADRVTAMMAAIDARRDLLEDVDKRLRELEALGVRLDEGREGRPSALDAAPTGGRVWHLAANGAVDWSTWEFGLQLRFAGRWKRGLALWLGPVRLFIGWAKRRAGAGSVDAPVERTSEDTPAVGDPSRDAIEDPR